MFSRRPWPLHATEISHGRTGEEVWRDDSRCTTDHLDNSKDADKDGRKVVGPSPAKRHGAHDLWGRRRYVEPALVLIVTSSSSVPRDACLEYTLNLAWPTEVTLQTDQNCKVHCATTGTTYLHTRPLSSV